MTPEQEMAVRWYKTMTELETSHKRVATGFAVRLALADLNTARLDDGRCS